MEVLVENLDEIVDGFQIRQAVVVNVNAYAEIEASVTSVDDFEVPELEN